MRFTKILETWRTFTGSRAASPNQLKFQNLIRFSNQVAEENPSALVDLVRLYLRPLQTQLLISCAESEMHGATREATPEKLFMPSAPLARFLTNPWNYPSLEPEKFRVDLARDPVLTCPWHRDRYVDAFAHIGQDKSQGEWRQDHNHSVSVILPWGIAFVLGGNHSIASGIVGAQGTITPVEVYDMSGLLDAVVCDGENYLSTVTQKSISRVHDYKMAALFELGRLMNIHGITPMRAPTPG